VGLIARAIEEAGIATLSMSSARDITRAVNPPRSSLLDYPLGHTSGRPGQPEHNVEILRQALAGFASLTEPGSMIHQPFHWSEDDHWKDKVFMPVEKSVDGEGGGGYADDRVQRLPTPQFQTAHDVEAAAASHENEECLVCVGIDF
jgi:hypothetical protein